MGIDWVRMRPKREAAPAELRRRVREQAAAAQAYCRDSAWLDLPDDPADLRARSEQYAATSTALAELLQLAQYPEDEQPDFTVSWRVYPITDSPVFPFEWRFAAYRTYLPEDLPAQVSRWRQRLAEVQRGKHRRYLLNLYLHDTSKVLHYHWAELQGVARRSLSRTGAWASRPALVEMGERILALPEPVVESAPLGFLLPEASPVPDPEDDPRYQELWQQIENLIQLTRDWDRRSKIKLRMGADYYPGFADVIGQANDDWLHGFLAWAERCCAEGMGLMIW